MSTIRVDTLQKPDNSVTIDLQDIGNTATYLAPSGSSLIGYESSGTGAVARTIQDKFRETVSVTDYGAKGDTVTNDTAAFQAALDSGAKRVYIPKGTYNVQGITIPSGVTLYGDGKDGTQLRPTASCDAVVRMLDHSNALSFAVNGNNLATKCFSIGGDYCQIEKTHAQFAGRGYYNEAYDVWTLNNTSSDNCIYSIYSAERGVNCVIAQHQSRGADVYGFYATYTTQQPQSIRFDHCLFFGNRFGIWFDKDTFFITITKTVIDGCTDTGVHFGESAAFTATDYMIEDSFIYADSIGVEIGPGCNHTIIRGGTVANGSFANIIARATATNRTSSVTIDGVNIGTSDGNSVILDSVDKALVQNCYFTGAPTSLSIATESTYTTGSNPVVDVRGCKFTKEDSVSAFNTRVRDCIGQVTYNTGPGIIPSGQSFVLVNHGLSRTPTHALITLQSNLGAVYWTDATDTQFKVNVAIAAPNDSPFSWEARCD